MTEKEFLEKAKNVLRKRDTIGEYKYQQMKW